MNGSSLNDWQWVVNGINERTRCVAWSGIQGEFGLLPVPQSMNHITLTFIESMIQHLRRCFYWARWVDKDSPVELVSSDSAIWERGSDVTGEWPAAERLLFDEGGIFENANFYYGLNRGHEAYKLRLDQVVDRFRVVPKVHTPIKDLGWLLDWMRDTLKQMVKVCEAVRGSGSSSGSLSSRHQTRCNLYQAYLVWDSSTGNIRDYASGETVGTTNTLEGFYTFAQAHLVLYPTTWDHLEANCTLEVVGTEYYLQLNYTSTTWEPPGMVASNLTVYYSAQGQPIGFPVNSTASSIGWGTKTFQNVQPGTTVSFGFTPSQLEPYHLQTTGTNSEDVYYLVKVWDFSGYLTYI